MRLNSVLAYGAVLASLSIVATGCKKEAQQQQQQVPELAVMTVQATDATMDTSYPTTLEGENDIQIRPQATGFLTRVCVQEGQHVNKGQALFEIDKVQLQAAVDQAQAAVAVAQANVNTAQTNANNNKMLYDKQIIGAPAYQTSADALNAAKAQLQQAQANLTAARKNLSYAVVTAPASGVIGAIDIKEGSLVSPSTLLTVLSNNADMQASFSFTQNELLELTQNGARSIQQTIAAMPPVKLQLPNGEIYGQQGRIVSISGVLDASTRSVTAKAIFPNPDGLLHSGNTGKVLIPTTYQNIMMIPQNATYTSQDMRFAFVVNDSNMVHAVPVTVSKQDDGQSFIVTEGLKPGERVVIEGVGISVQEGMTIKPKK
ncbi:MAG: efflux RND transporter periplasmic adaptor subunit [Muribaculaceae bacterium]|nr:efflux RND transporter periplasmic adaptor subunit [Muribaculaceae bacterium]